MNRLPKFPLRYLITSGESDDNSFRVKKPEILNIIRRSADANIELVQIREKRLSARYLFELTASAVSAAKGSKTKILVNDRFDIALATGAAGVHLTGSSMSPLIVRSEVPEKFLIGVSTHSIAEIIAASENSADFVLFGPVFETPGKGEAVGLELLREACLSVSPFPVIGVGGIDETNFDSVLKNGAAGFAAIRYLNEFVKIRK